METWMFAYNKPLCTYTAQMEPQTQLQLKITLAGDLKCHTKIALEHHPMTLSDTRCRYPPC